jgi:hypothetical protein
VTFGEFQADQILVLKRDLANSRREVLRLRRSRELWKLRYQWAALAARKAGAKRLRAAV